MEKRRLPLGGFLKASGILLAAWILMSAAISQGAVGPAVHRGLPGDPGAVRALPEAGLLQRFLPGGCDRAGKGTLLADVIEEDDEIIYESNPFQRGFPRIQDEELEKQEKAWEMLMNIYPSQPWPCDEEPRGRLRDRNAPRFR